MYCSEVDQIYGICRRTRYSAEYNERSASVIITEEVHMMIHEDIEEAARDDGKSTSTRTRTTHPLYTIQYEHG